jgi:NADH-quinone oxidoreductase subunit H
METLTQFGTAWFCDAWPTLWLVLWTLVKIVAIVAPLMVGVAYLTYAERKVIGYMQVRLGPNRVGPLGLLQPVADGLKLLMKEIVVPTGASKKLFVIAPMLSLAPALAVWAVVPFSDTLVLADIDASLLYILAIGSMGVYGVVLAGWASNSRYAFLGSMRAAAQIVSYEIAMGFALVVVLMVSGSLNLTDIVRAQQQGMGVDWGLPFLSWNWLPLLPLFAVYFVSGVAETNRAPFDVAEGESEIVAGFHVDYSGMAFAVFFLAEYAEMILVAALTSLLFLGGWASPVGFLPDGIFWLLAKIAALLFCFLWFRATFPRYRYDHIMRLGWKVFIPLTVFWLFLVGLWMISPWNIWRQGTGDGRQETAAVSLAAPGAVSAPENALLDVASAYNGRIAGQDEVPVRAGLRPATGVNRYD